MKARDFLVASALVTVLGLGAGPAAAAEPGRLFYSPAQRAQLETARARAPGRDRSATTEFSAPPPLRYDGIVVRSDGQSTRWVNGQPRIGTAGVSGLKPGQVRAGSKVYEPYQVLPAVPPQESAP